MASNNKISKVYYCPRITADNLVGIYDALGREAKGRVAVKLSTGEAGNPNHLSVDVIKKLVHKVDGTIVECNTAYDGRRNNTPDHLQTAAEHGFTAIAEVDIMDEAGCLYLHDSTVTDGAQSEITLDCRSLRTGRYIAAIGIENIAVEPRKQLINIK